MASDRVFAVVGRFLCGLSLSPEEGHEVMSDAVDVDVDTHVVFVTERLPGLMNVTIHVRSSDDAVLETTSSVLRWEGVCVAAQRKRWTATVNKVQEDAGSTNWVHVCISFTKQHRHRHRRRQ
jgi:hypothetical protein